VQGNTTYRGLGVRADQIVVVGDESHRKLRIENELTDEHGDGVKLRKGAHIRSTQLLCWAWLVLS